MDTEKKTVVITGASRGIGLATTKEFLKQNWRVVGTYLNTQPPIESEDFISVCMDQGSSESIAYAVAEIQKIAPRIDALVNNAGIIIDAHDENPDVRKIRKTLEVDLLGVIDLTLQILPQMTKGAHIVNIDSTYGAFSFPIDDGSSVGYRLAKTGLNMWTRVLSFRLQEKDIIVSSIDPGWVKTDMGNDVATETERPNREPEEPAKDIFNLVTTVTETGQFWRKGSKRSW
jgi:NAD(P)-dependent dehydrogenase (short-subunit alcohol dehydrogenase family)